MGGVPWKEIRRTSTRFLNPSLTFMHLTSSCRVMAPYTSDQNNLMSLRESLPSLSLQTGRHVKVKRDPLSIRRLGPPQIHYDVDGDRCQCQYDNHPENPSHYWQGPSFSELFRNENYEYSFLLGKIGPGRIKR